MIYLKKPKSIEHDITDYARKKASEIIQRIRNGGENALMEISHSLDGYEGDLRVSEEDILTAMNCMDEELRHSINRAIDNVRKFHHNQRSLFRDQEWEIGPGIRAGLRFLPVQNVAVYIPGGRYPLPSSAIMGIVPAQEAGVKRIVAVTPPSGQNGINPVILGTAGLLGIREIWKIGGAQAIAALALGIGDIEKVDMIVGPGNAFVTEAKRILYGEIGIDGLAGPSEILIIADQYASPSRLAADLMAQAEHDPMAKSTLICSDKVIAENTYFLVNDLIKELPTGEIAGSSWEINGSIIYASLEEAIETANHMAPEHLQLYVKDPGAMLERCNAYGAAFLGGSTCVPFGDYIAGTNHTLPTEGRAKFCGGLWTGTFLRPLTHLKLDKEGACSLAPQGIRIASTEGLSAHARSMKLREKCGNNE